MRIAFLGLGQMGRRMVERLDPQETMIWNRTLDIVNQLGQKGYRPVPDLESGVREANVVITMLRDHQAVREVGERGLFLGLGRGQTWIDMTTGDPASAESFHALAASQGARFVAAPVLGTLGPAAGGTLTVLVGGLPQDIDAVHPLLERFGTVRRIGSPRQALVMKLIVNTVLAYYMESVSESLPLADAEGLSRETVLEVLEASSVAAPVLRGKGKRWIGSEYANPEFPIDLLAKDLGLMAESGEQAGLGMPGVLALRDLFFAAATGNAGRQWDMSGVGEALVRRTKP